MARWDRDRDHFPKSTPRPVADGIRAHSGRQFGKNWWAKRWIGALEQLGLGSRLQRGRTYARRGQVVSIEIGQGQVRAKVQGSRARPYTVTIDLQPLPAKVWETVGREIARQSTYAASLLGGEMPSDIEAPFERAGATLFPARRSDLRTECSCPDWENPCKHIAAVFYLIGDELDRDPFLLFRLRGLDPKDLRRLVSAEDDPREPQAGLPAEPLPASPALFWGGGATPREALQPLALPMQPAPLLRRLGNPPFWRGSRDLVDWLAPVYDEASARALTLLTGDEERFLADDAPVAASHPSKSRDHAALEADIAAGMPLSELARRYDGRILRPYRASLSRSAKTP